MKVAQIMTKQVHYLNKDCTIKEAAQLMKEQGFGAIPIEDNDKLIGMITDRDLTISALAQGKDNSTKIKDCLRSDKIKYCFEDEGVDEVASKMGSLQIRRIPVMNKDKKLVGIVSLKDLATRQGTQQAATHALHGVSR